MVIIMTTTIITSKANMFVGVHISIKSKDSMTIFVSSITWAIWTPVASKTIASQGTITSKSSSKSPMSSIILPVCDRRPPYIVAQCLIYTDHKKYEEMLHDKNISTSHQPH